MADSQRIQAGTGARRQGVGAVAAGPERRKRGGLWWLLAALVALAVIAVVIVLLSTGGSSQHHHAASTPAAKTPASPTAAASTTGAASTGASAAGGSGASSTGGPAALVGGSGVATRPLSGALAAGGSIGVVLFAEARTGLDSHSRAVIMTAVKDAKARHARAVTVVGYTDTNGNPAANRTLSLERARQVATAMRRQLKDPAISVHTEARGEIHPVAPNTTPQGRQLDRRVAILIAR